MKVIIMLCVLVCAVSLVTSDLVCGTNYCKQHPCSSAPVTSTSCKTPAVYRDNHAGKCACCPACVTLLSEGATCKSYSKELGETPSSVCREPLKCLKGTCQTVKPRK